MLKFYSQNKSHKKVATHDSLDLTQIERAITFFCEKENFQKKESSS